MGSEEFVEEFNLMLKERALLYINADVGFSGNEYFRDGASPVMHDLIWEITQVISFEFLLKSFELKPRMGMGRDSPVGQRGCDSFQSQSMCYDSPSESRKKHKILARNTNFF